MIILSAPAFVNSPICKKRAESAFTSAEVRHASKFCSRGRFYAIFYTLINCLFRTRRASSKTGKSLSISFAPLSVKERFKETERDFYNRTGIKPIQENHVKRVTLGALPQIPAGNFVPCPLPTCIASRYMGIIRFNTQ